MTEKKPFGTSDLALAAFLRVRGFLVVNVVEIAHNKVDFRFKQEKRLKSEILDFYNKQTKVEPLTYWETVKMLKGMAQN